jgi:tRNA-Thr(GGU) m(6)t(6)A37 methyltransferase TsaA
MVRLNEIRDAEQAVTLPAEPDAGVYFIGRCRTPWTDRMKCPRQGRLDGPLCHIEVFEPWIAALDGIEEFERLEVLYWLHEARRDLVQQSPRNDGIARGTFSLRTPVRPNPIGTHIVRLVGVDGSVLHVRGLDCLDGTPLIDLKPDRTLFTPLAPRQPGDDQVGDAQ